MSLEAYSNNKYHHAQANTFYSDYAVMDVLLEREKYLILIFFPFSSCFFRHSSFFKQISLESHELEKFKNSVLNSFEA